MIRKIPLVGAGALALVGSACGGEGPPSSASSDDLIERLCQWQDDCQVRDDSFADCVQEAKSDREEIRRIGGEDCVRAASAYYECYLAAMLDLDVCEAPQDFSECDDLAADVEASCPPA